MSRFALRNQFRVLLFVLFAVSGCGPDAEEKEVAETQRRHVRVLRDPGSVTRPRSDPADTIRLLDDEGVPEVARKVSQREGTEGKKTKKRAASPEKKPRAPEKKKPAPKEVKRLVHTPPPVPPVVTPVAESTPAERRVPKDPFDVNCLNADCHGSLKQTERIHGPIGVGLCDPCHVPNPPGHHFKLTREQPELCTFCHLTVLEREFVHEPVRKNVCTSCHNPHGSRSKFLLTKETPGELCISCHPLQKAEFVHGPLLVGECSACHDAHQSDHPNLLHEPGSQQCLGCHSDTGADIASMKYVHKPAAQNCSSCHLPHYADNRAFLRKPADELCLDCHKDVRQLVTERPVVHGAVAVLDRCANCHTAHAADRPYQLRAPSMTLCLECHDKEIETPSGRRLKNIAAILANAKFHHGPIRDQDCIACHNSHASVNAHLLNKMFPQEFYTGFDVQNFALCFFCHQKNLVLHEHATTQTGFRDGNVNLHFVHVNRKVKGRTCRACHEIHASNLPKHMASGVPFGEKGWILPIEFKRTETGGSCTSACHKPKSYDRTTGIEASTDEAEPP